MGKNKILIALLGVVIILCLTNLILVDRFIDAIEIKWFFRASILSTAVLMSVLLILVRRKLILPLERLKLFVRSISKKDQSNIEEVNHQIQNSWIQELAEEIKYLDKDFEEATEFASEIGEGNYERKLDEDKGGLNQALMQMRNQLLSVAEEEKKRNWSVEGIAKFSEVLRNNQDDLEQLAEEIITDLVKYIKGNQGAFYLLHPSDELDEFNTPKGEIEMIACYAYERKKYLNVKLDIHEGMVGQSIIEKEPIYLTDIPDNYIKITSGLGKATPKSVYITPLKVNDEVYGALELASFNEFPEYQRKFIDELCESVASTLSAVKMSMNTKLLLEKAEANNAEMQDKEQQMQEIQNQLNEKLKEIEVTSLRSEAILEAINKTNSYIELDMDRNITDLNDMFCSVLGYKRQDLIGKHESVLIPEKLREHPQEQMMWGAITTGQHFAGEFQRVNIHGKAVWLSGTYNPVFDGEGNPQKVIMFANFTTESKEKELYFNSLINAIKSSVGVVELNPDFDLLSVNTLLTDKFHYKRMQIRKSDFRLFLGDAAAEYEDKLQTLRDRLLLGETVSEIFKFQDKEKEHEYYYNCLFSTVKDIEDDVKKFIVICIDVTDTIEQQKKLEEKLLDAQSSSKILKVSAKEKDTVGSLQILNDVLSDINKGVLDLGRIVSENKLPIAVFGVSNLQVTLKSELINDYFDIQEGDPILEAVELDVEQIKDVEQKIKSLLVVHMPLTSKDGQTRNVIFAPSLAKNKEESTYFMIVTPQ